MAVEITLPQLGVEMTSARLVEWVVASGATVSSGDVVAVVETDKITYDLEAPADGIVHVEAEVEADYPVGSRLGVVATAGEAYTSGIGPAAPSVEAAQTTPPAVAPVEPDSPGARTAVRIFSSPLARRIAADAGLDLAAVVGSGPGGVIRRRDVEAARLHGAAPAIPPPPTEVTPSPAPLRSDGAAEVVALTPMRRSIAEHMLRSLHTTAQMTDVREVDVTELVALRNRLRDKADRLGFKVSITDLVLRAAARALSRHPQINATFAGEQLVQHTEVNLGVAVSVPGGLLVPVVRQADRLSLRELHDRCAELAGQARERRVTAEDLEGGTFTVTNVGSYGSHFGTPVINLPQVAVLATGAVLARPVLRGGEVVPGNTMHLSLTVDHRVIDGESAGRFQTTLAELLGEPELLLVG